MSLAEAAGIIALGLSIAANVPYIIETIKGDVKPERVSWFIWTLLGLTYFWAAILENGAVLFTAGELIGPVVAFLLSLKYGVEGRASLISSCLYVHLWLSHGYGRLKMRSLAYFLH